MVDEWGSTVGYLSPRIMVLTEHLQRALLGHMASETEHLQQVLLGILYQKQYTYSRAFLVHKIRDSIFTASLVRTYCIRDTVTVHSHLVLLGHIVSEKVHLQQALLCHDKDIY